MGQKFNVDKSTKFTHTNGAIAYGPGGPFDCLGHWAKVQNCPIECEGLPFGSLRLTCYATGYADTFFSVPACTRYKGQHIGGYFTIRDKDGLTTTPDAGPVFVVTDRFKAKLKALHNKGA